MEQGKSVRRVAMPKRPDASKLAASAAESFKALRPFRENRVTFMLAFASQIFEMSQIDRVAKTIRPYIEALA